MVAWDKQGGQMLTNQQIEAILLSKIIVTGETSVSAGICMQYKKELWNGSIMSLHGE